jgi:Multicopper oxidase
MRSVHGQVFLTHFSKRVNVIPMAPCLSNPDVSPDHELETTSTYADRVSCPCCLTNGRKRDSNRSIRGVITPNGWTLPYKVIDGVKVFHLIAEPVKHEFAPGRVGNCWGANGTTPGLTIEVVEGGQVRVYVTNRLPELTSAHWHGILLPSGVDGVSGMTQKPIAPGETLNMSSHCASTARICTTRTLTR